MGRFWPSKVTDIFISLSKLASYVIRRAVLHHNRSIFTGQAANPHFNCKFDEAEF